MVGSAATYVTTPFSVIFVATTVSDTSAANLAVISYVDEYATLVRLFICLGLRFGQERQSQD
jgi:hypothetical protein